MFKYDLLVYLGLVLGLVPFLAACALSAYIIRSTPATNIDLEVRRMRIAEGVLMALAALFVSAAIFYFVDPGGGAGKEIFEKSYTAILALVGTIIGYIFGTAKK
jgi:hypothetical protein